MIDIEEWASQFPTVDVDIDSMFDNDYVDEAEIMQAMIDASVINVKRL